MSIMLKQNQLYFLEYGTPQYLGLDFHAEASRMFENLISKLWLEEAPSCNVSEKINKSYKTPWKKVPCDVDFLQNNAGRLEASLDKLWSFVSENTNNFFSLKYDGLNEIKMRSYQRSTLEINDRNKIELQDYDSAVANENLLDELELDDNLVDLLYLPQFDNLQQDLNCLSTKDIPTKIYDNDDDVITSFIKDNKWGKRRIIKYVDLDVIPTNKPIDVSEMVPNICNDMIIRMLESDSVENNVCSTLDLGKVTLDESAQFPATQTSSSKAVGAIQSEKKNFPELVFLSNAEKIKFDNCYFSNFQLENNGNDKYSSPRTDKDLALQLVSEDQILSDEHTHQSQHNNLENNEPSDHAQAVAALDFEENYFSKQELQKVNNQNNLSLRKWYLKPTAEDTESAVELPEVCGQASSESGSLKITEKSQNSLGADIDSSLLDCIAKEIISASPDKTDDFFMCHLEKEKLADSNAEKVTLFSDLSSVDDDYDDKSNDNPSEDDANMYEIDEDSLQLPDKTPKEEQTGTRYSVNLESPLSEDSGYKRREIKPPSGMEKQSHFEVSHSNSLCKNRLMDRINNFFRMRNDNIELDLPDDLTSMIGKNRKKNIPVCESKPLSVNNGLKNEKPSSVDNLNKDVSSAIEELPPEEIKIEITGICLEIVKLLNTKAEPLLQKLRKDPKLSSMLHTNFVQLSPDTTRFLLNEQLKSCHDAGINLLDETCNESIIYRQLLALHGYVKTFDCLINADIPIAAACISEYQNSHCAILPGYFDSAEKILLHKQYEARENNLLHPKLDALCEILHRCIDRKEAVQNNHKIAIILKRYYADLTSAIETALHRLSGLQVLGLTTQNVTLSQNISELQPTVFIATAVSFLQNLQYLKVSYVIEYERSQQACPWKEACKEKCIPVSTLVVKEISLPNVHGNFPDDCDRECNIQMKVPDQNKLLSSFPTPFVILFLASFPEARRIIVDLEFSCNVKILECNLSNCQEKKTLFFPDIVIDERACILVEDIKTLRSQSETDKLFNKLMHLGLKYLETCLIFKTDETSCISTEVIQDNLALINDLKTYFLQTNEDYNIKILFVESVDALGNIIMSIIEDGLPKSALTNKKEFAERHWLSSDLTPHEELLLHFPFLNIFSVQLMLTVSTWKELLTMSWINLKMKCFWIPDKMLKNFYQMVHLPLTSEMLSVLRHSTLESNDDRNVVQSDNLISHPHPKSPPCQKHTIDPDSLKAKLYALKHQSTYCKSSPRINRSPSSAELLDTTIMPEDNYSYESRLHSSPVSSNRAGNRSAYFTESQILHDIYQKNQNQCAFLKNPSKTHQTGHHLYQLEHDNTRKFDTYVLGIPQADLSNKNVYLQGSLNEFPLQEYSTSYSSVHENPELVQPQNMNIFVAPNDKCSENLKTKRKTTHDISDIEIAYQSYFRSHPSFPASLNFAHHDIPDPTAFHHHNMASHLKRNIASNTRQKACDNEVSYPNSEQHGSFLPNKRKTFGDTHIDMQKSYKYLPSYNADIQSQDHPGAAYAISGNKLKECWDHKSSSIHNQPSPCKNRMLEMYPMNFQDSQNNRFVFPRVERYAKDACVNSHIVHENKTEHCSPNSNSMISLTPSSKRRKLSYERFPGARGQTRLIFE